MSQFIPVNLTLKEVENIEQWEKENGIVILYGELTKEGFKGYGVKVRGFYIDVWNCRGTVVLWDGKNAEYITEDKYTFDRKLYNELVETVVYDDNGGAINFSGHYYPQSDKAINLFNRLKKTLEVKNGKKN